MFWSRQAGGEDKGAASFLLSNLECTTAECSMQADNRRVGSRRVTTCHPRSQDLPNAFLLRLEFPGQVPRAIDDSLVNR